MAAMHGNSTPGSTTTPDSSQFVVHIIESPSPDELRAKRHDGQALEQILRLMDVRAQHHVVVDKKNLQAALAEIQQSLSDGTGGVPLIHFSLHANGECIGLTTGEIVSWRDLAQMLEPINSVLDGRLVVAMSACQGYSGVKMAMSGGPLAFGALFGPDADVTWPAGLLAFSTLYHYMSQTGFRFDGSEAVNRVVDAMNAAAAVPPGTFKVAHGASIQDNYKKKIRELFKRMRSGSRIVLKAPAASSSGAK